jgi:hypothetical protein
MENADESAYEFHQLAERLFDEAAKNYGAESRAFAGGTFVTGDGTLLVFNVYGREANTDDWQDYDGLPFPAHLHVAQYVEPSDGDAGEEDQLIIEYMLEMRHGIPVCARICIESQGGTRDIRPKDLPHIRIDDVLEAALRQVSIWNRTRPSPQQRRESVGSLMRRRRMTSDETIREVARVYEENINGTPTLAVSDHFGISKSAADKRVRRARDAGYITKTAKAGRRPQK